MNFLHFMFIRSLLLFLLAPFMLFACNNGNSGGGDNQGITHTVDFDYVVDATNPFKVTFTSHPYSIEGLSGYSWDFND